MSEADLVLAHMRDLTASGRLLDAIAAGRAAAQVATDDPTAAPILTELAWLAFQTGTGQAGLHDADHAIACWRAQGDRAQEAQARATRALIELELGHGEAAAEQALARSHTKADGDA